MTHLPDICVALKIYIMEYQPYTCGEYFRTPYLNPIYLLREIHEYGVHTWAIYCPLAFDLERTRVMDLNIS